jgi:beta-galactosidase
MTSLSRRQFLQRSTTLTLSAGAARLLPASVARALAPSASSTGGVSLDENWEHLRMPLAGPWEAWLEPPLAPWTKVSLPHCFNAYDGCDPDTPAYRGKGWYRTHIHPVNPFPAGRTLLHFEGAGQSSEVYIGSELAGRHIGGYDEFVLDITDLLSRPGATAKSGTLLSVLCDNSPNLERLPSDLSDFTLYGGLYRRVHLIYTPSIAIETLHIRSEAGKGTPASIRVKARLYNPSHAATNAHVTISITDPAGKEVHRFSHEQPLWDGMSELTAFSLSTPALWSPRTPQLYQCILTLHTSAGESTHVERFGIRFFEFQDHGPFFLNGERLLIQGTHRHEDFAGYAAATPAAAIREEMQMIRDMGANFIRLGHYQQQRLVLDLCDELGLLVWEELSWCRSGVGDEAFQQQGKQKLTTLIEQHYNHPSIILWSLGNEDDWPGEYPSLDQEAIRSYMQQLNTLAHRLDDTRLTAFRRCDFARDVTDVYSPSIWAGWYGGRYLDYEKSLTAQRGRVKHMLHVEWGADSHAGRHSEDPYKELSAVKDDDTAERGLAYMLEGGHPRVSRDGDWSESYACDLFDWHLKVQQSLPWLTGAVQWIFADFTTPLRPENPVPRMNQKGLVQRDFTKKESYFVFQSFWSDKPMAHIYGHTWPVRWGKPGELRTVKVYSNCPSAELFLNGTSVGTRKRDIQDFPAAGLRWEVAFVPGHNTLHLIATSATGNAVTDEISLYYESEPWGTPAQLTLKIAARKADRVTLEASLLDAHGTLCLDARTRVRFSLSGDGTLLDNLGTVGGSRVVELCNGRVSITLLQASGTSTAALSAEGLPTVFCTI